MLRLICLSLFIILVADLKSASSCSDSSIVFFPTSRLRPSIFLDPLECQASGGSYLLFRKDRDVSLYSNVILGFRKPLISKQGNILSWEAGFGVATFSQFDLIRNDDGTYLAGLLNNDYKLSGDFSIRKKNIILCFRLFHFSSHPGDDYMLRTNDLNPSDKSANYEQADLMLIRNKRDNYLYAGIGEIYTKYVFRKRFSLQVGGLLTIAEMKSASIFTSMNTKLLAENDFIPDIRYALGVSIKRRSEPLVRIWAEYYSGRLPYGTLHYGRVQWAGLATSLTL